MAELDAYLDRAGKAIAAELRDQAWQYLRTLDGTPVEAMAVDMDVKGGGCTVVLDGGHRLRCSTRDRDRVTRLSTAVTGGRRPRLREAVLRSDGSWATTWRVRPAPGAPGPDRLMVSFDAIVAADIRRPGDVSGRHRPAIRPGPDVLEPGRRRHARVDGGTTRRGRDGSSRGALRPTTETVRFLTTLHRAAVFVEEVVCSGGLATVSFDDGRVLRWRLGHPGQLETLTGYVTAGWDVYPTKAHLVAGSGWGIMFVARGPLLELRAVPIAAGRCPELLAAPGGAPSIGGARWRHRLDGLIHHRERSGR